MLEDHALSLLKAEHQAEKKGAERLMANLTPRTVPDLEAINPRVPWINEPDCLNCHIGFQRPENANVSAFNTWTSGQEHLYRLRSDPVLGLMCEACHGNMRFIQPITTTMAQIATISSRCSTRAIAKP